MALGERDWEITQTGYCPEKEAFFESIFSIANGYMGMRGFDEEKNDDKGYLNCTFIAGIFDYFKPGTTDMVNVPNFNNFKVTANGKTFSFADSVISEYSRFLNMKNGTLRRSFIWEDNAGNRTRIESLKFMSIYDKHICCIKYSITPLNYEGPITVETGIDGCVSNNPVNDDQVKNDINPVTFLNDFETGIHESIGYLSAITKGTRYKISMAFCVENMHPGTGCREEFTTGDKVILKSIEFYGKSKCKYEFCKYISVYTSRDNIQEPAQESIKCALIAEKAGFEMLYDRNCELWERRWDISDIRIEGDDLSQQGIRYNIFQLLQAFDDDNSGVSIGARALTHSRYKGCYFWDTDIFMLPYYLYTNPKAARNLVMYRYNTLQGARENAKAQNMEGARYAWMCTTDGLEQCDTWDIGLSEVHVTADIAYAVNNYAYATGDEAFMADFGAEILIETARYWRTRFTYESKSGKYNLLFVKGPDEYCGVSNNNTYSIFMAINNFKAAALAVEFLKCKHPDKFRILKDKLSFDESEIAAWDNIASNVNINYDKEKKLYIEDDNFLKLEPRDIKTIKSGNQASYHNICFDYLQRLRVVKQADVLLLMLLLPDSFSAEEKKAAWDFYEPITLHDSSLSFGSHAQFAANIGLMDKAYDYFLKCVRYDLDDVMGNTGREGLHMASMGSAWQAVVFGFAGVSMEGGSIRVNPALPKEWNGISFSLIYRKKLYRVHMFRDKYGKVQTTLTM